MASTQQPHQVETDTVDFIVIGSGAGGGPLACRLAESGFTVMVLEAGDLDPSSPVYETPLLHAFASEDEKLSWSYFVKHYNTNPERDNKYNPNQGIFYPRGATLGGSTATNAMVTIPPRNRDWDDIAALTGDESWRADRMRRYFERLERCHYTVANRVNRHGSRGWLQTSVVPIRILLRDRKLQQIFKATAQELGIPFRELLHRNLDINDWHTFTHHRDGIFSMPMAITHQGKRNGTREYLCQTIAQYPDRLFIRGNALVSKILFDANKNAIGVQYEQQAHAYRADPLHDPDAKGSTHMIKANYEVILSAGSLNSPQVLKLSGIGAASELRTHGIEVIADRPGVGENLQDRYEIGLTYQMNSDFNALRNCAFTGASSDPGQGSDAYKTNGIAISILKRSTPQLEDPDLFMFGVPGNFRGFYPGYSEVLFQDQLFSWIILKSQTRNHNGQVKLKDGDPRSQPDIHFKYFEEGSPGYQHDQQAIADGIQTVRRIMTQNLYTRNDVSHEHYPGHTDHSPAQLTDYITSEAFGHHASSSNKIGTESDHMAVLDSQFRVYGVNRLRVVDASVFPNIPGWFIVAPTYMVSEKAADVISAAYR